MRRYRSPENRRGRGDERQLGRYDDDRSPRYRSSSRSPQRSRATSPSSAASKNSNKRQRPTELEDGEVVSSDEDELEAEAYPLDNSISEASAQVDTSLVNSSLLPEAPVIVSLPQPNIPVPEPAFVPVERPSVRWSTSLKEVVMVGDRSVCLATATLEELKELAEAIQLSSKPSKKAQRNAWVQAITKQLDRSSHRPAEAPAPVRFTIKGKGAAKSMPAGHTAEEVAFF